MSSGIKANCRICNNSAPVDEFKLHHEYRQMVCKNCFKKGPEEKKKEEQVIKQQESAKPAGWDKEDEYLEKISKMRDKEQKAQFKRIPGTDQINYTCAKCTFSFKYDPFKKKPSYCPYCDEDVPRLKNFSFI